MRVGVFAGVVSLLILSAGPLLAAEKQQTEAPAVETIQQANQKLNQLAKSAAASKEGEYPLGAGDLIKIDVFDIPELSQQIRIDPGGYITMPLIPQRIQAAGITPYQLESKIADLLMSLGLVSHPQVTVFVVQRVSQPITVIGAVEHPMVYQAVGPTSLLEVLSAAGGLTDTAADYVTVSRAQKGGVSPAQQRVSLRDLIDRGDPNANIMVRGGDVVTVPKAGIVYVVGAVVRPGGFVIQNDTGQMTALKALALAGGTQEAAKTKDAVIIRKEAAGKNQQIRVNLKDILSQKAEDVQLRPNDILFVPDSAGKKALTKAAETALSISTGIMVVRGGTF